MCEDDLAQRYLEDILDISPYCCVPCGVLQSCSWVPHTRCHHSSTGELLSSAFCVCKHSQLISLASVWGIIFWQALYYIQLLYLHMTPHWALKFSCPLDRGKDEFLVHISHISLLTITASWMARTSFFLELIHSKTRDQGEKTHDSW